MGADIKRTARFFRETVEDPRQFRFIDPVPKNQIEDKVVSVRFECDTSAVRQGVADRPAIRQVLADSLFKRSGGEQGSAEPAGRLIEGSEVPKASPQAFDGRYLVQFHAVYPFDKSATIK